MNSLDAQCFLYNLAERDDDAEPPDQWQHFADGTLAYRFGDSENTYSWQAPEVADIAAQWQSAGRPVPRALERLVASHRAFAALVEESNLDRPDRVVHDLRTDEVTAIWDKPKLMVVVEPDGEAAEEEAGAIV